MGTRRIGCVFLLTVGSAMVTSSCAALEPPKPRHVTNAELTAVKTGKVVDVDTSAGVPDANVIVTWYTLSTGIPGYGSTRGSWCDLQKIVTTDAAGNFTIPDVSRELNLSDRGTHVGETVFGVATQTHEKTYALAVFKPGSVRAGDMEIVNQSREYAKQRLISDLSLRRLPDVEARADGVTLKPIQMQKADLAWGDLWAYYARVPLDCSDRMANDIASPRTAEIRRVMQAKVRPMACELDAKTPIDPLSFSAFVGLSHPGALDTAFVARVKTLDGAPNPGRFDPLENVSTTAGTLCRALREEEHQP